MQTSFSKEKKEEIMTDEDFLEWDPVECSFFPKTRKIIYQYLRT